MWKKWTRIICSVLAAAMLLTELPMSAMAASNTAIAGNGDANGDGVIDSKDISAIRQYIVGDNPSNFQFENADVTGDGSVDLKDLLGVIKIIEASGREILSVSFYDGDRLIETLFVEKDNPLSEVPAVSKSSKANAVLLGYYTDQAFTEPFYADNPVTENMNVYAKYQDMSSTEELNFTSFALMDQSPDISFRIQRVSGNITPDSAATLIVKDGSDPVGLKIDPNGDGFYTVKAPEGFRKGASYELTLAEGWVFEGKDETIRTAAFSIAMEEVTNLRMNDAIIYIEDTDTIDYKVDGKLYEILTTDEVTDKGGAITYETTDADQFIDVKSDDILCVYVGEHPLDRSAKNSKENMEPAVYVKVTGINGKTVSFAPLDADDQVRMYDIPDNFPLAIGSQSVSGNDSENTGSASGNESEDPGSVDGNVPEDAESVDGNKSEDAESVDGNESEDTESVDGNESEDAESVDGNESEDTESVDGNESEDTESVNGNAPKNGGEVVESHKWKPDLGADKGTVTTEELIEALDIEMYRLMMSDSGITFDDIREKISIGDYITIYSSSDEIKSEGSLYYAKITDYKEETGEITYIKTTKQAILESMDLYQKAVVDGDDLVTEEQKEEIEALLLSQLEKSGFAEDAAYLLSDMVTKTDGFRKNMSVQEFLLTDEDGNPLTDEEIKLLNLGSSFELSDDIKLKVELITKGEQLHYGGGVQLAIQIEAEFETEVKEGKVAIKLSASFVQEAALNPSVRGSIVTKEILFIPVPIGVEVSAAIDIRSYTAFSFAAEIYTVEEEDKDVWENLKDIYENPKEILGLENIPEGLQTGLEKAGDIMKKIDEIKGKIDKASETVDKIKGYKEDLETLWNLVETNNLTTREEWEEMEETLGKTNVAYELLDMMDLTTETDISTEYLDSMQALMDKYVETIEKDTGWVELVNEEIFAKDIYVGSTPIVISTEVDFIVRADMSIAIGSNLEYEVGKRYNFWFKIGLFKPTAGNSSMDLIDERFAFQFYVMGRLGLKAGIRAKLAVGLGSAKFASVGIATELGPYVKLYGFFVYDYSKYRPANTQNWTSKEQMAGALYLDFGLYYTLSFEANALGDLFEYSYDFLDEEVPLLTAGDSRYYYENAYKPVEDDMVIVRDEDGNSSNGITMVVPDSTIALSYVDLDTGWRGNEPVAYNRYNFTVSNPNFKIDPDTGVISVDVPENVRFMECDLTVTYLYGKLAFSQYDMSVTIPLVWTNLSTEELSEFYTASVRVGNDQDGYKTVWSKRVLKNQEFDLPSDEEIKEMISWSDAKFTGGSGYGSQGTTALTLIQDTVYDYNVNYKTYSVTVDGIQNADGSTTSKTYTAKYGEYFDFSDLAGSRTEIPGKTYTRFAGVKTDAVITVAGEEQAIDLTEKISGKTAEAVAGGIRASAEYVDDGVMARFEFTGINHVAVEQWIRKGTAANLDVIGQIVAETNPALDIVDITPIFGTTRVSTVYQVICGELTGPKATITFHENGGNDVADITKAIGGYLGIFPIPERTGYSFNGWYTDDGTFQNRFDERGQKMMEGGLDLYAKWTPNEYNVTFHVNGGNELNEAEQSKTVTYDSVYGSLPVPTRTGYAFIGWFTETEGGTQVTADTPVTIAGGHTLYAYWRELKQISPDVFDFGDAEGGVYEKGMTHNVDYSFDAGQENFTENSFTIKYMRQGNSEYEPGLPINAGTYNATISRPADEYYDKFEYTYTAVITIDKAVRTIGAVELEAEDKGYTYVKLALVGDGGIDDLSSEATFTYQAKRGSTVVSRSADRDSYIYDLSPATSYNITVKVTDDPNYKDAESTEGTPVSTMEAPTDSWVDEGNYNTSWYYGHENEDVFTLESAEDLAGLSALLKKNITFKGKTIKLTADVDLRGHKWYPIAVQYQTTIKNPWTGKEQTATYSSWFKGTFDGGNHKITGVYVNGGSPVGLFGWVGSGATIENILLDHSYIRGGYYVGGIVGYADHCTVNNCVNYAQVIGTSTDDDDASTGGIVGYCADDSKEVIYVVNCVNYGSVQASGNHTGGIVGYLYSGEVRNNANYGRVSGKSCVGGIVGEIYRKTGKAYNNFTVGTIKGTGNYVAAVVGRIEDNDGDAAQIYYLRGTATCNGSARKGIGTKNGSDDTIKEALKVKFKSADFTSPTSKLSQELEKGAKNDTLIQALNRWVTRCNKEGNTSIYAEWVADGRDGYPLPKNSPIPDAVHTRVK